MDAVGHCLTGFLGGEMVITALNLSPAIALGAGLGTAGAAAGAAILNDFDHPNSTASTAFPILSPFIHECVVELHYMVCSVLDPHQDRKPPGAHRGVTHWWPFPIAVGALISWGCYLSSWTTFGVLTSLFALAARGLTVPKPQEDRAKGAGHRMAMRVAQSWMMLFPPLRWLAHMRRKVDRHTRLGGTWTYVRFPTGKFMTLGGAAGVAWAAMYYGAGVIGLWLGPLICGCMWLHNLGDSPTEMGIPGFYLTRLWRLPKWLAFKAGGWFERAFIWVPLSLLSCLLIPGLLPHAWAMQLTIWTLEVLGVLGGLAVIVHAGYVANHRRKGRWTA